MKSTNSILPFCQSIRKSIASLFLTGILLACAACSGAGPSIPIDPSATAPSASPGDTARHIRLLDAVFIPTPEVKPYVGQMDTQELYREPEYSPLWAKDEDWNAYEWLISSIDKTANPQQREKNIAVVRQKGDDRTLYVLIADEQGGVSKLTCDYDATGLRFSSAYESDDRFILHFYEGLYATQLKERVIAVSKRDGSVTPLIAIDKPPLFSSGSEYLIRFRIQHTELIGGTLYYEVLDRASDDLDDPLYSKGYSRLIGVDIQTLESTVIYQSDLLVDLGNQPVYPRYCYTRQGNENYAFIGMREDKAVRVRRINLAHPDEAEEFIFEGEKWLSGFGYMNVIDRFLVIQVSGPSDNGTYLYDPDRGDFYAVPYTLQTLSTVIGNSLYTNYYVEQRFEVYRYDLQNPDESAAVDISELIKKDGVAPIDPIDEQEGKSAFIGSTYEVDTDRLADHSIPERLKYCHVYYKVIIDWP